ncbi:uncharacterized protein EI90DRAFT_3016886 [Cantharellus anzutake]|uniref:uncharacterized protein n=1 Tax=Cantharellus anzutake TaxID=1750568 RepID=UPI001902D4CB|nr:uncharacterized protein EI90DRAFT_3016886 [Cantharellus anzutake]KAF8330155.1 hypothetical protein EI90DRAFT_3016886 [Cantharellus anzutake]
MAHYAGSNQAMNSTAEHDDTVLSIYEPMDHQLYKVSDVGPTLVYDPSSCMLDDSEDEAGITASNASSSPSLNDIGDDSDKGEDGVPVDSPNPGFHRLSGMQSAPTREPVGKITEFEELGIGSSTWLPGTPQVSSSEVGLPPDRGRALTNGGSKGSISMGFKVPVWQLGCSLFPMEVKGGVGAGGMVV